jgi:flagellin
MGLRINTNIPALNATRTLRKNTQDLNKSLERLSSGLRINRAADDAAGLAIAEGFRICGGVVCSSKQCKMCKMGLA